MNFLDKLFPHRTWQKRINDIKKYRLSNFDAGSKFQRYAKTKKSFLGLKLGNLNKTKMLKYLAIACFAGLVLMVLSMGIIFAWFAKDLPRPDKIVRKEGFATKIYDRNDKLLYEVFADEKRIPVELTQIPIYLRQATVAIEDKDFYKHEGFDPKGYLRIVQNVIFRRRLIGGSTLTQQIVKNVLLSSERTLVRKLKEFVLAIQIERLYSKDEILQIYLNEAPYGGTAWGVAAAAERYFGKSVSDLTFIESVILAGMPQSPSVYSPYGNNPEAYKYRTGDVLRRMREDNYITKDQEKQALIDLDQVKFKPLGANIEAPHFVMYVKSLLEEKYGQNLVEQGGLSVKTTIDLDLQNKIQDIVKEEIEKVTESYHITNGSVVIIDPQTGQILSMIGSKNYFADDYDGEVNVALSLRQPGSSIKPVTYATALNEGYTPESMIMDVKTEFPGLDAAHPYVPKNYDGKFNGPVSLRVALGNSLNIPAVKLLALVSVPDMMQLGYDMGLSTFKPSAEQTGRLGLSVTLGGGEVRLLELTTAYSAFANKGKRVEPVSVLEIKDNSGKILESYKEGTGKKVMSEQVAYLISHILSDNKARLLTFGENSLLNIAGRTVAVKTGTTDDQRDNWAIGWTPQVIVGVWVGNNDNSKMTTVASGVSGASPIWRQSILEALNGKPVVEFAMPANMEWTDVDKVSGYPAHDGFETKPAILIRGSQPSDKDPIHVKLRVCKSDENKLAPPEIVAMGDYNEKEFFVFKEKDPINGDSNNMWQKGIDEWLTTQGDSKYHPPTEQCKVDEGIAVRFDSPGDHNKVGNEFDVKIRVGTSGELDRIEIFANDKKVGEIKDKPYQTKIKLDDGTYELKAKGYRKDGKSGETSIRIGVNRDWDWVEPTPTPSPTSTPTATIAPTPTPTPKKND